MTQAEPKDVREMRQRIKQAGYGRDRVDGKPLDHISIPPAASMIHAVLMAAEYNGLSGDDAMTMLAYHALVGYEKLYDMVWDHTMLNPAPSFIVPSGDAG